MGKRRIRNLVHHGVRPENIFGFDPRADRRLEAEQKHGITTFPSFKKAADVVKPDVYVISSPPDTHYPYFLHAARNKKHLFVEHPTTDKGYRELIGMSDGSFVTAPSSTMRFHPAIKQIKKIIAENKIGKILSFQYHLGMYLPDWHPWEDFRDVYFSKKKTGACREMFDFELIWLTDVLNLGKVGRVKGFTEKLSDLDMSADDHYSAILKFVNKDKSKTIGSIVIDLLARKPLRTLRVIGAKGVLDWEWQDNVIKVFDVEKKKHTVVELKKGRSEKQYVTTEDMYEEEIGHFLNAIKNKTPHPFSFTENWEYLKVLFALEKNARSKK